MSEHAISNAKGWLSEIVALTTKLAEANADERNDGTGIGYNDPDEVRREIDEGPLSIQVRDGWRSPGSPRDEAETEEYEVLLSTGGPALRIYGQLDGYNEPDEFPRLQWQDWGTPWTDYRETTEAEDAALLAYVRCFYFGE